MSERAFYRIVSAGKKKGKTSVGEKLVTELVKRDCKVAVIKHSSRRVDVEGKDTDRYIKAGAGEVLIGSPSSTALFISRGNESLSKLFPLLDPEYFIVIVEGFSGSRVGKRIVVASDPQDLEKLNCKPDDTLAVISSDPEVERRASELGCKFLCWEEVETLAELIIEDAREKALSLLPGINCGYCGFDNCSSFASSVLRGERTIGDCPVLKEVELVVDGVRIGLNPFVKRVFSSVLEALVSTLKGIKERPKELKLIVRGVGASKSNRSENP